MGEEKFPRVCAFQDKEDDEKGFGHCALIQSDENYTYRCEPEICPTYQTWQLLKTIQPGKPVSSGNTR